MRPAPHPANPDVSPFAEIFMTALCVVVIAVAVFAVKQERRHKNPVQTPVALCALTSPVTIHQREGDVEIWPAGFAVPCKWLKTETRV